MKSPMLGNPCQHVEFREDDVNIKRSRSQDEDIHGDPQSKRSKAIIEDKHSGSCNGNDNRDESDDDEALLAQL